MSASAVEDVAVDVTVAVVSVIVNVSVAVVPVVVDVEVPVVVSAWWTTPLHTYIPRKPCYCPSPPDPRTRPGQPVRPGARGETLPPFL